MSTDTKNKKRRGGLILQAAATAGVATAVLLGGFGGFSMWNDSVAASTGGNIISGTLDIVDVTTPVWKLTRTDGVVALNTVIDITNFKASPGDQLTYTADVNINVVGTDMKAALTLDGTSYTVDPSLVGLVTVTPGVIAPVTFTGTQTIPVSVVVDFSDTITGQVGQTLDKAVKLDGMAFKLNQTT